MAAVLKTASPQGLVGSNPTPSSLSREPDDHAADLRPAESDRSKVLRGGDGQWHGAPGGCRTPRALRGSRSGRYFVVVDFVDVVGLVAVVAVDLLVVVVVADPDFGGSSVPV